MRGNNLLLLFIFVKAASYSCSWVFLFYLVLDINKMDSFQFFESNVNCFIFGMNKDLLDISIFRERFMSQLLISRKESNQNPRRFFNEFGWCTPTRGT